MALGNNFFTVSGVETIANNGHTALDQLANLDAEGNRRKQLVEQAIDKLSNLKSKLSDQEKIVLQRFNCKDLNELNTRIQEFYNKSGYEKFIGVNLRSIVDDYTNTTSDLQETLNIIGHNIMQETTQDLLQKIIGDSMDVKQAIAQDALSVIHKAVSVASGSSHVTWSDNFKGNTSGNSSLTLIASKTTTEFKKRVDKIKINGNKKERLLKDVKTEEEKNQIRLSRMLLEPIENNTKISDQSMSMELGVKIALETGGMKGSEAIKKMDSATLNKRNENIIKAILQQLNAEYQPLAHQMLKKMIHQDPYMFFVGSSTTQLEGVLGEIAAVHAIIHLLGTKYTSQAIQWVATRKVDGKQLSADIILKDIGGIDIGVQVKNTMRDLSSDKLLDISFASMQTEALFQKLNLSNPEALEDVITSDVFNVPYQLNGTTFVQVGSDYETDDPLFPKFITVEKEIDELTALINLFLIQYAPNLIYMTLDTDLENQLAILNTAISSITGNFLYIVGNRVHSASEMLQTIINNLEVLKGLKTEEEQAVVSFKHIFEKKKGDTEHMNIVSYLNGTAGRNRKLSSYKVSTAAYYNNF